MIKTERITKIFERNPSFILYDAFENFPARKIVPITTTRDLTYLKGPGESSIPLEKYGEFACAKSISNYPTVNGRPYREGDPICDRYFLKLFENRIIVGVADAHNWGLNSRKASKRAISQFIQHMEECHKELNDLKSVGPILLASLALSHQRIQENHLNVEIPQETRSVCICGGVLLENDLHNNSQSSDNNLEYNSPFFFAFAIVGDVKCYHYSKKSKSLTCYGSPYYNQFKGFIGGTGNPELSKIIVKYIPCDEEDLIMILTSGASDNFDPIVQGKDISEFSSENHEVKHSLIDEYSLNYVKNLIGESPVVYTVVESILNATEEITKISREFMEANPHGKLNHDPSIHPGRMDHATCVCFRVGRVTLSYEEWVNKS